MPARDSGIKRRFVKVMQKHARVVKTAAYASVSGQRGLRVSGHGLAGMSSMLS